MIGPIRGALFRFCFVLALSGPLLPAQQWTGYKGKEEVLPQQVGTQPVPFSHKRHVSYGATCLFCRPQARTKERAGLPDVDSCMSCHETIQTDNRSVKELARIHRSGEPIEWVRVYRVPDFVFFSHRSHFKAEVQCEACHGAVAEREVLAKEISTSMIMCMNCHERQEVSNDCGLCHTLGM